VRLDFTPPAPDAHTIEAVEQELQAFSYIVSHDLAASLRHLSEFSRLLVDDLAGDLTERQRAHAEHIRSAALSAQTMMEQLLVFSRTQQKPLDVTRLEATAILELPMLNFAEAARQAGADITVEPLGEVFADPTLLGMAIGHLLDNAIKFRRPGTPLRISVRPDHGPDFWRLRIQDNGLGVDPAQREKAFQMFSRLHGEGAYPGTGAGLALARRIARRHGGEVRFLDCDEGACVELALPRTPGAPVFVSPVPVN
jgi:signal transduction histidine kinase